MEYLLCGSPNQAPIRKCGRPPIVVFFLDGHSFLFWFLCRRREDDYNFIGESHLIFKNSATLEMATVSDLPGLRTEVPELAFKLRNELLRLKKLERPWTPPRTLKQCQPPNNRGMGRDIEMNRHHSVITHPILGLNYLNFSATILTGFWFR